MDSQVNESKNYKVYAFCFHEVLYPGLPLLDKGVTFLKVYWTF